MHTLRIMVDGHELISTAAHPVAWLSWDVITCLQEEHYAGISVSGSVEIAEGKYDMLDWLVFHPLPAGADLELQILPGAGSTPFRERRTPAEQEALHQAFLRAKVSGEFAAARIRVPPHYRLSCSLVLEAPDHEPLLASTNDGIDTLSSSGMWSSGHKSDHWRLHLGTVPAKGLPGAAAISFWCPIREPVHLKLGT